MTNELNDNSHDSLRITLAQVDPRPNQVADNLDKVQKIVDSKRGSTDLIVFPELTLSGYSVGDCLEDVAISRDDPTFEQLVDSTEDICIAVGFVERSASFKFYNSMAVIKNRKVLTVHRKIYLPKYGIFEEGNHFTLGDEHDNVNFNCNFQMAPLICADAWSPALLHFAAMAGADIFLFSACSPVGGLGSKTSSKDAWQRINRHCATLYGAYVVFVNRVGKEGDLNFWGGSELIDPFGNVVIASDSDKEEVLQGTVNLSLITESREILPTIKHDRPEFLQKQLERSIRASRAQVTS